MARKRRRMTVREALELIAAFAFMFMLAAVAVLLPALKLIALTLGVEWLWQNT